jgi:hypothetical protein
VDETDGNHGLTCYTEGSSHFVTSMTAPVASGWSGCGWGLHPLESAALSRRTRETVVSGVGVLTALSAAPIGVQYTYKIAFLTEGSR